MEKTENIKKLDTYEPQVLRKAEITRILNSVKNASFNPNETNNSPENSSFKKRSLLDIALESSSSKNSSDSKISISCGHILESLMAVGDEFSRRFAIVE